MKSGSFFDSDPWLEPFIPVILTRYERSNVKASELSGEKDLVSFADGHFYYGLKKDGEGWVFREWAPNATEVFLIGTFSGWQESPGYRMRKVNEKGDWEIKLSREMINHGDMYKLSVHWDGGSGERIPSYANWVIQDETTKIFSAQVWAPDSGYEWKTAGNYLPEGLPVIYEAHVGMATPEEKTGTYREFTEKILPVISGAGYNTVQLMAVQEHPFYGSFGYHVSSFFAPSSRFGSPDDLKELIDTAHSYGLRVIMDLVHSHSVKNYNEGLGLLDGSPGLYFHTGERRNHIAWDSLCFDYSKKEVLHFLLSNCRYWLEEFKFDGYRFDGITSMIYYDHGLGKNFISYEDYFNGNQDEDALTYLSLANRPEAVTIAEEMSGMPGIAAEIENKGIGFDYRLSMGVPDYWIKLVKDTVDENWDMGALMHELTQHRPEEKVISYCESHDQALVGDKTLIFRMIDADMYSGMGKDHHNMRIDRGIALHKMIRLITFSTSAGGYLNFMGNEFGHPEWIDFPREGNRWSFKYARRQWHLAADENLKYRFLSDFDREMISLNKEGRLLDEMYINRITENSSDKVIAYSRGDYLFVFNFHPVKSYTDYGIPIAGNFNIVLDSDDPKFGGFDRLDRRTTYRAIRKAERYTISTPFHLFLYLPARSAQVFKKINIKKVTDI